MSLPILAGAQSFGYGPSSKLVTIARYLKKQNFQVNFWGQDTAFQFVRSNWDAVGEILLQEDLSQIDPRHYLAVCTVMDPRLAAWGYFHDVPVVALDSLYWFWTWPRDAHTLQVIRNSLKNLKLNHPLSQLLHYLECLPPHTQQYVLHLMASRSYVQQYPSVSKERAPSYQLTPTKTTPIVDVSFKTLFTRDTFLISFSGLLNPLVSRENARTYLTVVAELIEPVTKILPPNVELVVTVNPELLDDAKSIFGRCAVSLSHTSFLRALNRSLVVAAPAGITTIYECLAYGTPLVILPEQHDGHFENYVALSSLAPDEHAFRAVFPEALMGFSRAMIARTDPDEYTGTLYKIYEDSLREEGRVLIKKLSDRIARPITRLLYAQASSTASHEQQALAQQLFHGNVDATAEISTYIGCLNSALKV